MKRLRLIRHLTKHGCEFVRDGGEHSIWKHGVTGRRSSIPRHSEIKELTARRICKQLGVPAPT